MEQNLQSGENSAEIKLDGDGEPMIYNSKKHSKRKAIIIILIIIILAIAGYVYYSFFNKEDKKPEIVEVKTEVLEDKKVEEVEVDKNLDTDKDKLPDYLEKILGTAIDNPDTDGDGYGDFDEIKNGYNPLNEEKYTEEEWEAVKEKIKREDEGLFGEMFEKVQVEDNDNIVTKKCEFPKNIGEYDMQEKENLSEDKNKGIIYDAIANYSISNDITIFTPMAMIEILSFDNENSAKEILNDLVKNNFKDCEINDIKGFCYYNIREKDKKILATGKFYWLESQTLKIVFVNGVANGIIIEDAEKNVKENLTLFVSKFKNCKTESAMK